MTPKQLSRWIEYYFHLWGKAMRQNNVKAMERYGHKLISLRTMQAEEQKNDTLPKA